MNIVREADLTKTDLSRTNLNGADLIEADLRETLCADDVPIIIYTEYYQIVKCKRYIKIGCQVHAPEQWKLFTDDDIKKMAPNALVFWNKYKTFLLVDVI